MSISAPQLVRSSPPAWLSIAYRPMFCLGALHAVAGIALWLVWTEGRRTGAPPPLAAATPPIWAHAHAMVFGVIAPFAFGFLGTAFPRWSGAPAPGPSTLVGWATLLAASQLALVTGLIKAPPLIALGPTLECVALLWLIVTLWHARRHEPPPRRLQPALVLGALALGPIAAAIDGVALVSGDATLHRIGSAIAIDGFLLLLVVGVSSRIVPFFTSNLLGRPPAPRPPAVLATFCGLAVARVAAIGAEGVAIAGAARGVLSAALALLLANELRAFAPGRALRMPMLAVLYLGLGWIVFALALDAFAAALPSLAPLLALPVRHALVVGGFSTLVLGLATRVSFGHGGRSMRADRTIVVVFALLQLAALLRVGLPLLGEVWPDAPVFAHLSGLPWGLAFALWLARTGPLLIMPRPV